MIDLDLLVYAGTLAVFFISALAIGVLCLIAFTALASVAGTARARRRKHTQHEESDAWDPEDLLPGTAFTEVPDRTRATAGEDAGGPGDDPSGEWIGRLRRPGQPRMIQQDLSAHRSSASGNVPSPGIGVVPLDGVPDLPPGVHGLQPELQAVMSTVHGSERDGRLPAPQFSDEACATFARRIIDAAALMRDLGGN